MKRRRGQKIKLPSIDSHTGSGKTPSDGKALLESSDCFLPPKPEIDWRAIFEAAGDAVVALEPDNKEES